MFKSKTIAQDYLDFHWIVDWQHYAHVYTDASNCTIDFNQLVKPALRWCAGGHVPATIMTYTSFDYELPLLQINPDFADRLHQLFPAGDVFHQVAKQLFSPKVGVLQAAAPYQQKAARCVVGMHIRNHKSQLGDEPPQAVYEQFASIANGLAQERPGTIFVASDADIFAHMAGLMPKRRVWWSDLTQSSVGQKLAVAENPGTDLSAVVDMYLLARCQQIIVTSGSTFGAVAAAISNTVPVYAARGLHADPYHNPWFWKALSSEPFMYKLSAVHSNLLDPSIVAAMHKKHPLALQFAQAHP